MPPLPDDSDTRHMLRALNLARRGLGRVEPNPMVGCVIAESDRVLGEGWHQQHGGPHAEIEALTQAAGQTLNWATMYVTLEPCCHHGKTPPCVDAILNAGIPRVVVACRDPFPQVDGGGVQRLKNGGVDVRMGVLEDQARRLLAPYLHLLQTGRPWVIAKWAMTLDGRIASSAGESQWISNARSRAVVHQIRGRVDAVLVGSGTALADDPMLTARPPGVRLATRIVVDGRGRLPLECQLMKTLDQAPLIVAVGPTADADHCRQLAQSGAQVLSLPSADRQQRLIELLDELGQRQMTNVLVEGGAQLLGGLFDARLINEVHTFIAGQLIGGQSAPGPLAGVGLSRIADAARIADPTIETLDGDIYIHGPVVHGPVVEASLFVPKRL